VIPLGTLAVPQNVGRVRRGHGRRNGKARALRLEQHASFCQTLQQAADSLRSNRDWALLHVGFFLGVFAAVILGLLSGGFLSWSEGLVVDLRRSKRILTVRG